ncbi:MAG: hypothetical protein NTW10_02415 [Bacteroidetes bacterium]|nr:hypothetical protein [Bacteroidota bacterium]
METISEKMLDPKEFHEEQCRFLALRIPALNMLKREYRITHNEITLLAVIYFLRRTGTGSLVYKAQMKNFLGNWQRAYLHRKLKTLEIRKLIWSKEILNRRRYYLTCEGDRIITQFNKLMINAYDEYIQSQMSKKLARLRGGGMLTNDTCLS